MLKKLGQIFNFFFSPFRYYGWFLFGFAAGVLLIFACLQVYIKRQEAVKSFNGQISNALTLLNQSGWDIAYDKASYSPFSPFNIIRFQNFKIYSTASNRILELNIPEVRISASLFENSLQIIPSKEQELTVGFEKHSITTDNISIAANFMPSGYLADISADFKNISISDLADIESARYASRRIAPKQISDSAPFFENFIEISNIKLNGLLDYPLGQNIERLYLNADIIGTIKPDENFQSSIQNWLLNDGKVEVKEMVVNWSPLLMVGKGELTFNEKLRPILHLKTSSKAFLELLKDLDEKQLLESKGMFVVNILLNSKAFKALPEDQYLTLSTPIDIQEDGILVEKIKIKSF